MVSSENGSQVKSEAIHSVLNGPVSQTVYNKVAHNHEGDELKSLIKALKENGIEVILDVVFNHTAEGNEMGPCFSFKGIDNNVYYMLTPDAHYYNFSGCGNVMNCNHPVVRNFKAFISDFSSSPSWLCSSLKA